MSDETLIRIWVIGFAGSENRGHSIKKPPSRFCKRDGGPTILNPPEANLPDPVQINSMKIIYGLFALKANIIEIFFDALSDGIHGIFSRDIVREIFARIDR
jgi:hypothetical protein